MPRAGVWLDFSNHPTDLLNCDPTSSRVPVSEVSDPSYPTGKTPGGLTLSRVSGLWCRKAGPKDQWAPPESRGHLSPRAEFPPRIPSSSSLQPGESGRGVREGWWKGRESGRQKGQRGGGRGDRIRVQRPEPCERRSRAGGRGGDRGAGGGGRGGVGEAGESRGGREGGGGGAPTPRPRPSGPRGRGPGRSRNLCR